MEPRIAGSVSRAEDTQGDPWETLPKMRLNFSWTYFIEA